MRTARLAPRNESGVLWRGSQLRCAAHATTAGAVSARRPAMTPMAKARRRIVVGFMMREIALSRLDCQDQEREKRTPRSRSMMKLALSALAEYYSIFSDFHCALCVVFCGMS